MQGYNSKAASTAKLLGWATFSKIMYCSRHLADPQGVINRYYQWHKEKRRHWSLRKQTPQAVWTDYFTPSPTKTTNLPPTPEKTNHHLNRHEKTLQLIGSQDAIQLYFNFTNRVNGVFEYVKQQPSGFLPGQAELLESALEPGISDRTIRFRCHT